MRFWRFFPHFKQLCTIFTCFKILIPYNSIIYKITIIKNALRSYLRAFFILKNQEPKSPVGDYAPTVLFSL